MLIQNIDDFNLEQTFECGQCFRWNKEGKDYIGIAGGYVMKASNAVGGIKIECANDDFSMRYFDLERNYGKVKNAINKDRIIKQAILQGSGIRILRQQPWETLVSFIISANNNIPRIKKIIESLCRSFGEKLEFEGKIYYDFPAAEVLSGLAPCDLFEARCGFRDKYIIDAARKVASGEIDLQSIYNMSAEEGRQALKRINGVGDKVADCVLLFAYQKFEVFPKDVWIKRIINDLYGVDEKGIDEFVVRKFGKYGGFAQQYLFYYARGS